MILTCPECATSYFVDDSRIPPAGRRVKCSSCGHRWRAGPEGPLPDAPEPAPDLEAAKVEPAVEDVAPALDDDIESAPAEVAPIVAPARRPAAGPARGRRQEARSSALVWAVAAALAAALIAGAIIFREQIVRVWPKSSAAYAGLGLAVEGGGLVFEKVHVQPTFLAGRPVLSVMGGIHNVRDVPVNAPPVRVSLLDRAGQPVAAKIARPMDANIPAGETRHFVITLFDPPSTARDLEVRFETGGAKAVAPLAAEAALTPPPVPAAPVPAPAAVAPLAAPPAAAPVAAPEPRLSPAAASEHG
jgi:predicted Zn finger-like uncharacterized protein